MIREATYTPGNSFDALIVGFYRGKDLTYAAKVRAGFVPAIRREVFAHIKDLKTSKCPFVNLPEKARDAGDRGPKSGKLYAQLTCRLLSDQFFLKKWLLPG